MRAHTWTPATHNLCEWTLPHFCGAPVAWRLQLQDARFPEYYCAECARLVAVVLGLTDPTCAVPLHVGQPSGDLTVHASAPEGAKMSEAADVVTVSGLCITHSRSCDEHE
jgi:hypothetical protein